MSPQKNRNKLHTQNNVATNREQKKVATKGNQVVRLPQPKQTQLLPRGEQLKPIEIAENLLASVDQQKKSTLETPAELLAKLLDQEDDKPKSLVKSSNTSSVNTQKKSTLETSAKSIYTTSDSEYTEDSLFGNSTTSSFNTHKESTLATSAKSIDTTLDSEDTEESSLVGSSTTSSVNTHTELKLDTTAELFAKLWNSEDEKEKSLVGSSNTSSPMNLNENSNDLERIKRIMHSKKITIDINTRSSLDEEQIKKIKSIFQANPQLKKLPRISLIESKITLIQNALQKNSASINQSSLTRMLDHYTKLKKILNDMELDLPYSISNHQGELYIMYRHKLGEGVNGRVKLAQNLTTGKVLAAKIQQEIAGEKDYAKQAEIEMENNIAQLLNIHSATIQRNTYSVTKQDLPVTKVKNTIFLDFVEGDTLGNYLSKEIAKFKKAATSKPKKFIPSNTSNSSQDELSFQKNILQALLVSLQALKSLSEKGVVHTDLHFDNIMYLNDPTRQDASSATIIDFGNSVLIDHKKKKATLDNTHIIKRVVLSWRHEGMRLPGIKKRLAEQHPHYAPELITNNEVDSRVDIYSFGQGIKRIVDVFENNKVPVSEAFIKQLKDIYTPMIKQNPNLRKNIDFHIRKCELLIKNIMNSDAPKQKATDPLPPVRNSRRGRRM